jgi:hypothetical protein
MLYSCFTHALLMLYSCFTHALLIPYASFTHALLMLIQVALRDPNGFRPLVIGRMRGRGKVGKKTNYTAPTHALLHALLQGGSKS